MPRAGLTPGAVADAALALVDEAGPGGLTLAAVAARTGVATSSLYKHVASRQALLDLLGARIYHELADRLTTAALGRSGDAALIALAGAYQDYVTRHPHRYSLMPQTSSPAGDAVAAAGARLVTVLCAALTDLRLGPEDLIHAARVLRSALHGFTVLSMNEGFGLPVDKSETHRRLVATIVAGLRVIHRPGLLSVGASTIPG